MESKRAGANGRKKRTAILGGDTGNTQTRQMVWSVAAYCVSTREIV